MPLRRVIEIDQEKCNGCGICVEACHEGAIGMVEGKAKLLRDDYCDGLGDCLPTCPTGAISFIEREAAAYDETAVAAHMAAHEGCPGSQARVLNHQGCPGSQARTLDHQGCPGSQAMSLDQDEAVKPDEQDVCAHATGTAPLDLNSGRCETHTCADDVPEQSQLTNWPLQIKLAPTSSSYFNGADLLVAADCAPFSFAGFHNKFLRGRICLIGCPKLDGVDYSEKLAAIISDNDIRSITVVRMVVPCCGGLENAVKKAIELSGKIVPLAVVTLSLEGEILCS